MGAVRVNLLHAHGSPTRYLYSHAGCRCGLCKKTKAEYDSLYRETNREQRNEASRRYYETHREEAAERDRRRYEEDPARRREWNRCYREAHVEEDRQRSRAWRLAHLEERAESGRLWREDHAVEIAARNRTRRALKRNAIGTHTAADVRAQHKRQKGRCYWCGGKAGRRYHVDHVVPLSLGGSNGPENIVVSCPFCNLSKHAKHPMDFAGVLC